MLNAFTVDVEDYFQVSAFESIYPREMWDSIPDRLDHGVKRLLDLTEEIGVKGTFYFLGWTARRRPDILREVLSRGHEIGCHSMSHLLIYEMSPADFRNDLRQALDAIEDVSGEKCTLYRAPSFSITRNSLWALEILAEAGIRIDSSIYPIRHDRYGLPGAPRGPYRPLHDCPDLIEFPPSSVQLLGMTIPCAGGGYLRLYPTLFTLAAIRRINEKDRLPALLYVHPWELDPDQPSVPVSWLKRRRHRVNLARTERKLKRVLTTFRFGSISESVESFASETPLRALSPHQLGAEFAIDDARRD